MHLPSFWGGGIYIVTLQAQKEYPPEMQSKDKFLIQSTKVAASTDMDEIPPDTVSIITTGFYDLVLHCHRNEMIGPLFMYS